MSVEQQADDSTVSFRPFAKEAWTQWCAIVTLFASLFGLYVGGEEKGMLWWISLTLAVAAFAVSFVHAVWWVMSIRKKLREVTEEKQSALERNQDLTAENENLERRLSDATTRAADAEAALGRLPDTKRRNAAARDVTIAADRTAGFREGQHLRAVLAEGTASAGFHRYYVEAMHDTEEKLGGAEPVSDAALSSALGKFSGALGRFLLVFDALGDSVGHHDFVRPLNPDRHPGTGDRVLNVTTGQSVHHLPPDERDQYRQDNPDALLADIPTLESLKGEVLSTSRDVDIRIHELRHEWDLDAAPSPGPLSPGEGAERAV